MDKGPVDCAGEKRLQSTAVELDGDEKRQRTERSDATLPASSSVNRVPKVGILPPEVLDLVFSFMNFHGLCAFRLSCRRLKEKAESLLFSRAVAFFDGLNDKSLPALDSKKAQSQFRATINYQKRWLPKYYDKSTIFQNELEYAEQVNYEEVKDKLRRRGEWVELYNEVGWSRKVKIDDIQRPISRSDALNIFFEAFVRRHELQRRYRRKSPKLVSDLVRSCFGLLFQGQATSFFVTSVERIYSFSPRNTGEHTGGIMFCNKHGGGVMITFCAKSTRRTNRSPVHLRGFT